MTGPLPGEPGYSGPMTRPAMHTDYLSALQALGRAVSRECDLAQVGADPGDALQRALVAVLEQRARVRQALLAVSTDPEDAARLAELRGVV